MSPILEGRRWMDSRHFGCGNWLRVIGRVVRMSEPISKLSLRRSEKRVCEVLRWNRKNGNREVPFVNNAHINTKKPTRRAGFFNANAGDYLISHTLSRAVPSARRGLTSVFGMGTGVTLAVCSPASLGAALGSRFPTAISLHTRAVFPRNESGKLAPQTCI